MEGPVISASRMAACFPALCMPTASMDDTNDFPTPPFPLTTAITFPILLKSLGFSSRLCGAVLSPHELPQVRQSWVQS